MRRALLGLGLVVALLWPTAGQAERRVALVIGNSAYQHASQLANPVKDAGAMADLFRRAGFEVVEARNDLGSLEFKRAVREFAASTRNADIAVMYYAGHGIEIGGTNYLIPTDAKLANDLDAQDEAVPLDRIVQILEPARRLRLVILDACRDNPFLRGMRRSLATRAVPQGLARVEPTSSDTLVAFAAKAGSTAEDGSGANSPFTTALLKHITVPGLDVRLALGRVRDQVIESTGRRQEPFVYGSLGGATVALVPEPKAAPVAGPPPAVNPVADIRRDYELAERIGTKEAWDSFLAVHTTGLYANLARAAQAKLAAVDPGRAISVEPPKASPPPPPADAPPPGAKLAPPEILEGLPSPSQPASKPDAGTVAHQLQTELKRVGCDPGTVDGDWGAKARRALDLFNKHAGTKFDVKVASLDAVEAVRGKSERVCPLVCGRGTKAEGETCVAIREPASKSEPASKREAPAKHEPVSKREPAKREAAPPKPAAPAGATARQSKPAGPASISPLCESFFTGSGGRRCCTYDSGGAPRIICQ
jgi:hypothetical protein